MDVTKDNSASLPDIPNRDAFDAQWFLTAPEHAFDARSFWAAYRSWLAERGYTLFDMVINKEDGVPFWVPPSTAVTAPVPYAFYHRDESVPTAPWQILWVQARFAYGQDTQGRNIAIKVIQSDSEEEHIYNRLLQCPDLQHPDTFANVLPPLCILRLPHQLSFVVMPMWGDRILLGEIRTVKDVMDFITDLLRQRVAHRDIKQTNVMVNYFSALHIHQRDRLVPVLEEHRSSSQARYCLFDYNLSIRFPLGMPLEKCRSPSTEAFRGWDTYHPWDVYQGEPEYNPFAFDVACLGNLFRFAFADAIPSVNMLAPLIDCMTTHVTSQRFTAAQAYDFCKEFVQDLSEDNLRTSVTLPYHLVTSVTLQNCWDRVPPAFAKLWSHCRSPPVPKGIRFLHWICSFETGAWFVGYVRKTLRV